MDVGVAVPDPRGLLTEQRAARRGGVSGWLEEFVHHFLDDVSREPDDVGRDLSRVQPDHTSSGAGFEFLERFG
jgi:hypothetical protein